MNLGIIMSDVVCIWKISQEKILPWRPHNNAAVRVIFAAEQKTLQLTAINKVSVRISVGAI